MFTLWGPEAVAGLSKGSCSLLKPKMTSMLWTRPPTATPPPLPISWKLLGERQLSSTIFMVSSDKCIRASGQSPGPLGSKYAEVLKLLMPVLHLHLFLSAALPPTSVFPDPLYAPPAVTQLVLLTLHFSK